MRQYVDSENIVRKFEVCGNHVTVHAPARSTGTNERNKGYAQEASCSQGRLNAPDGNHVAVHAPVRCASETNPDFSDSLPVVYLHVHDGDGSEVLRLRRELGCRDFVLAAIRPRCWNDDLTPWECPGLFADEAPFAGKAAEQLRLLESEIVPCVEGDAPRKPEQRVLAGYSLAGLFATWACFNSAAFGLVASASGSLWYPDFASYAQATEFARKPSCAYFSLGSKEARTPSRLLRNVAQGTRDVVELFGARGVPTAFEQNPGNHFKDPTLRMAKGIAWVLGR